MQQKEIALAVGVSRPTVSEWEHQKKDPSGARLIKLATLFNVPTGVVLNMIPIPDIIPVVTNEPPEPQEGTPRTPEARIVSGWMDDLPQDVRKQIQTIVQAAIANSPELLRRKDDADAEHS